MREVNNEYDIINIFGKYIEKNADMNALYLELSCNNVINSFIEQMKSTKQNEKYHAEGSVWNHTMLVVDKLKNMVEFYKLSKRERIELLIATVFHDIGKIKTTKVIDGEITSPHHAKKGAQMMRKFLWRNCNMAGSKEMLCIRENICMLIRYHMRPYYIVDSKDAYQYLIEISVIGELVKGFNLAKLCLLAMADNMGRICEDRKDACEQIELCNMMADEIGCLYKPYQFTDKHTRRAYFNGRNVNPNQTLFDDTWGTVYLMSALPGTGKDTWIKENKSDIPIISLDAIRKELNIKPTGGQGEVVRYARELAKEYLRKKQSFVWNATNLTQDLRKKLVRLFESYGANVTIIYLEIDWKTELMRNFSREEGKQVPIDVLMKMQSQIELPTVLEAKDVKWIIKK